MTATIAARETATASMAIAQRGLSKIARMPAIMVQSAFFPVFFFIIYVGLYAGVIALGGFGTDKVANWYVPFMMLQGGSFAGVGAGFGTAVDIDTGFFDRLLLSPIRRPAIFIGTVLVSAARGTLVATIVLGVGFAFGARLTGGVLGLIWLYASVIGLSVVAAGWALGLIYRVKDQRIAPLFPIGIFLTLFMSTAQVPLSVATGWLQAVARINPITNVLRLSRQAFLDGGVTWSDTWGGLLALGGMIVIFSAFALRGLRTFGRD